MNKGFKLSPLQSWTLVLSLVVLTVIVIWLIKTITIAINNIRAGYGFYGILEALNGYELAPKVNLKKVVDATRQQDGLYKLMISDGESSWSILALTTKIVKKSMKDKTRAYVGCNWSLNDRESGDSTEVFVVHVNYESITEVEDALNRYFKGEYLKELISQVKHGYTATY